MKDMLGDLMRKLAVLPLVILKVVYDLVEKLAGESGQEWLTELKKFLRKESCWMGGIKNTILKLISGGSILTIDAVDGQEILANAADVFTGGIDADFRNWGADESGSTTAETEVEVYEMEQDANFAQMFGSISSDVSRLCLTQAQIKNFVKKHRNWLRKDGYATFFLFQSKRQFFVAYVYFFSDGRLGCSVHRFEYSFVWHAEYRHRVVVPQL